MINFFAGVTSIKHELVMTSELEARSRNTACKMSDGVSPGGNIRAVPGKVMVAAGILIHGRNGIRMAMGIVNEV